MSIEARVEQSIKEFQEFIQIPEYDIVIERLIRKAYSCKIEMSLWPGSEASKAQDANGDYYLWIGKERESGNLKELIYDIMHEMGHCLDPIKLAAKDRHNVELEQGREIRAWDIADREFQSYPELQADKAEYIAYRNKRLSSYELEPGPDF